MSDLYRRMKAKGIDMSWYERSQHKRGNSIIPLDDQACSSLSIYLLKKNGSLWTIGLDGTPYKEVRPPSKEVPREVYVCACCKKQWSEAPLDKNGGITRDPAEHLNI